MPVKLRFCLFDSWGILDLINLFFKFAGFLQAVGEGGKSQPNVGHFRSLFSNACSGFLGCRGVLGHR